MSDEGSYDTGYKASPSWERRWGKDGRKLEVDLLDRGVPIGEAESLGE